MITESQIRELVEEKIAGTPNYIAHIVIHPGNHICVFLDSDDKVLIGDCVGVAKYIESKFDREVEDFELEVSSAGVDEPLRLLRQYKKRFGRQVEVLTNDGKKITGKLIDANDTEITLEENVKQKVNGKKKLIINNINLTFSQIKETKVVISFK